MMAFEITTADGSRQVTFLVVMCIFLLGSYTAVILRFYCRRFCVRSTGLDDYLMGAALVAVTGMSVMNGFHVSLGTGRHIADLNLSEILIPTLKHWWAFQLVYPFTLYLVKASILAFYVRILTLSESRTYVWMAAAFITVQTVVVIFINAFECRNHPARAWSPSFPKGCNNLPATYYSLAAINILTDIVILVLPIPSLAKLQLHPRKKWALIGIFSTGGIAILASILRFYGLHIYVTTADPAYDAIFVLLWSQVEVNAAIISASAPALRPIFHKTFRDTSQGTNEYTRSQSGISFRSRGPIELQSYSGKNHTVVNATKDHDDNSSQEHMLEAGRIQGILQITETRVYRQDAP